MKQMMAAVLVGALAFSMSATSDAAERWHTSTISMVYPLDSGDFVVIFSVDSTYCSSTGTPKYMYVAVGQNGVTASGAAKIYAAALTAFALGKQFTIAFDDSTPSCYVNRAAVAS